MLATFMYAEVTVTFIVLDMFSAFSVIVAVPMFSAEISPFALTETSVLLLDVYEIFLLSAFFGNTAAST